MDELLKAADELGREIKKSSTWKEYQRAAAEMNEEAEARNIFDEYIKAADEMRERERAGDIIESYEKEEFRELTEKVKNSASIIKYLRAEEQYAEMLNSVQRMLEGKQ